MSKQKKKLSAGRTSKEKATLNHFAAKLNAKKMAFTTVYIQFNSNQ